MCACACGAAQYASVCVCSFSVCVCVRVLLWLTNNARQGQGPIFRHNPVRHELGRTHAHIIPGPVYLARAQAKMFTRTERGGWICWLSHSLTLSFSLCCSQHTHIICMLFAVCLCARVCLYNNAVALPMMLLC